MQSQNILRSTSYYGQRLKIHQFLPIELQGTNKFQEIGGN